MKRYKVHCFLIIVMCILLGIGRATNAIDYAAMIQAFKDRLSAVKVGYNQVVNYVKGQVLSPAVIAVIKSREKAVIENPYKNRVAMVRRGNELNPAEQAYRQKRLPKVKRALEKMLHKSLDNKYIPTIAIVGSGGGIRAALGTIGGLAGAEIIGLLGATTYITALSGSTWALATWYAYGTAFGSINMKNFRNYFSERITTTIFSFGETRDPNYAFRVQNAKEIADMLTVKMAFNQPITMVDIFGSLLANRLLDMYGDDRQMVYLSAQSELIKNGYLPYPIHTAIDGSEKVAYLTNEDSEKVMRDSRWYEFTPHEIGCAAFALYVPTWAYGRKFDAGVSVDFAPEQSIGFDMGTFGSAFAAHVDMAWREIRDNLADSFLKPIIEKYVVGPLGGKRAFYAEVNNYMRGMSDIPNAYVRLEERETLKLVDAGLAFNLPYPPVSSERPERMADIIIFLDSSAGTIPNELIEAEKYARAHGLKFPVIDYTDIEKKTMSVFKDETDPTVPVVIYAPRISDAQLLEQKKNKRWFGDYAESLEGFDLEKCTNEDGVCNTFKFEYRQEESEMIMNQMEFNIVVNKYKIDRAINWVIDQRSPKPLPAE